MALAPWFSSNTSIGQGRAGWARAESLENGVELGSPDYQDGVVPQCARVSPD